MSSGTFTFDKWHLYKFVFLLIEFAARPGVNSIQEVDEPALIPHIAEASSIKYPYEVLFRSLHKLLMDTATSEYFTVHSSLVY